jgi:UDP-GlcNAc:undecaprenyl-phosphate/decaprenyl-phosphate GlcNAc-1-phosphate transferase
LLDKPQEYRKIHTRIVPRLGGVAIYISLLVPTIIFYFKESNFTGMIFEDKRHFWGLFIAATLVWFIGIIDDIRGVRPSGKVIFIALASIIAFYSGFRFGAINTPFGEIRFGLMALPVTMLWLLGTTNAINLIDGMDGLASGVSLVSSVTIFVLSVISGNALIATLAAAFTGAVLGFLVYNFPPASIFLGDSGSLLIGFLLGSTVLLSSFRHVAVGLAIPLIIFALPIADTALAILRRWAKRMPVSSADRDHIHHRLLSMGLSQKQAIIILYGSSIFLGILAIGTSLINTTYQIGIVILLIAAFVTVIRIMNWKEIKLVTNRIQEDMTRTRAKTEHWSLFNKICNEIKFVKSEYRLVELLTELFKGIELNHVIIWTNIPSTIKIGNNFLFVFSPESIKSNDPIKNAWSVNIDIKKNNELLGYFYAIKDVSSSPLPPEISQQVQMLIDVLTDRLIPRKIISSKTPDSHFAQSQKDDINKILIVNQAGNQHELISSFLKDDDTEVEILDSQNSIDAIQKNNYRLIIINAVIFDTLTELLLNQMLSISVSLNVVVILDVISPDQEEFLLKSGCISIIRKPVDLIYLKKLAQAFKTNN